MEMLWTNGTIQVGFLDDGTRNQQLDRVSGDLAALILLPTYSNQKSHGMAAVPPCFLIPAIRPPQPTWATSPAGDVIARV
jgi:hypothetical protein